MSRLADGTDAKDHGDLAYLAWYCASAWYCAGRTMSRSDRILVSQCRFCSQRARDVAALRRDGQRGKQLGIWEREILRRSGASQSRSGVHRMGGLPLLSELFPEREFREDWQSDRSPSKPVLRAAAARLERAGLVSLLVPTRLEADRWLEVHIGRSWEHHEEIRRRLLLTNFSWRSLLGDQLIAAYPAALGRSASSSRIRWDSRLMTPLSLQTSCARWITANSQSRTRSQR